MNKEISQEQLNAFIDGELDVAEKEEVFARLQHDQAVSHQLCELRAIKEMLSHGYAEPPEPIKRRAGRAVSWGHMLAASVLLMTGLASGWLGRDWVKPTLPLALAQANPDHFMPVSLAAVSPDANKIILHLDSAEPHKLKTLLDDVDYLVQKRRASNQPIRVEVIANSYGLDLLRKDMTPYAARIDALARQHTNVSFVACGQTIRRLGKEGVKVELLPEAKVAQTAVGHIVDRLQHGWTYIKV